MKYTEILANIAAIDDEIRELEVKKSQLWLQLPVQYHVVPRHNGGSLFVAKTAKECHLYIEEKYGDDMVLLKGDGTQYAWWVRVSDDGNLKELGGYVDLNVLPIRPDNPRWIDLD